MVLAQGSWVSDEPHSSLPAMSMPVEASRSRASLTFSLVSQQSEFEALEPHWRMLMDRHGLPHQLFNEFNWLWHWANIFVWKSGNSGISLAVIVGRRGNAVDLILPLACYKRFGLTVLRWMGEPINQYGDGLGRCDASRDDWDAALKFASKATRADVLYLRKIRSDARIKAALSASGLQTQEREGAPYITIDTSVAADRFEQGFSAKDRKNRRRHRKRLAERGEIATTTHNRCPSASAAARQAIQLKQDWLSSRNLVSSAVMASEFAEFFQAALCHPERPTGCELTMLTVAGTPAAITIGIRHGSYYAAHLTSYDPELEHYSPGSLLLEDNLRRLHGQAVQSYDFLAPAFKYKLSWSNGMVDTADYAQALTLRGQLYQSVYLNKLRPRLRRMAADRSSQTGRLFVRAIQLSRLG